MGILGALSTAVSGLSAQSFALENISGNIANSSTIGFKRVDTSFVDLIPDAPAKHELAGSVSAYSQLTNTLQGTLSTTGVNTNMALSGEGFFAVAANTGSAQAPAFKGASLYTRRGDFASDAQGYLVNGAGNYLVGTTYDPATGAVVGGTNAPIQLSSAAIPAKVTGEIDYSGNLPSTPKPSNYDGTPASALLKPADFGTDPSPPPMPPATGTGTGKVVGSDKATFLAESVSGGQVSVYNSAGTATTVQLRWAKTANASGSTEDTWQLFYGANPDATGTDTAWQNINASVTFDNTGKMTSSATVPINGLTANGLSIGNVTLKLGAGGLTQYGDSTGEVTSSIDQNGYTSGTLSKISVGSDGSISGSYSNGQTAKIAQVAVAHFANDDGLKRETGGAYSATSESGNPSIGLNGTKLTGGSVEQSNTDISDEFSKMIVTQQAYSANTKVMSTAQQMLQDVINIIR